MTLTATKDNLTGIITIIDGDYRITIENVGGTQHYSWNVFAHSEIIAGSRDFTLARALDKVAMAIHRDQMEVNHYPSYTDYKPLLVKFYGSLGKGR